MMNKPLAIADKPFRIMKTNTSKERNFYTQGQQYVGGMLLLFIVCLFTSCNTGTPGGPTKHEEATVPPGASISTPAQARGGEEQGSDPPLVKELRALVPDPLPAPRGEEQGDDSLRATFRALAPDPLPAPRGEEQGDDSLRATFRALAPDPLPAPRGEEQGDDSLRATFRALAPDPLPAQGGGQQGSDPPFVKELRSLASDLQIDQQPDKLDELGKVLLALAESKQAAGVSHQDLSSYTDAAILYQHVLSICEQKVGTLCSQEASALAQSAYQGLAQIEISMLMQARGAEAGATTPSKPLPARIAEDKQRLEAIRTKARKEAKRLAAFRDKQGTAEEVRGAEAVYIEGSKKLFADIAGDIKSLLGDFYQAGEQALGPPPCKYAIMGVGSIALQQTTPYSDLEFAILMEDAPGEATAEAWRAYFRKLTHLVHFRVINLGETVLPFSQYKISLDHLGRKGLNFDLGGKTPLGRKDKDRADKDKGYELIQSVAGMMAYLKNEGNKMEHIDKLLPYILERTCYIHGDQKLHNDYLAAQRAFWSSCQDAAGKHAYQERMRKKLLEGVSELDHSQPGVVRKGREQPGDLRAVGPKLGPGDAGKLYDVKQEIYRLPDRLLYGLATYYGLRPESAWDAVDKLKAQGIIGVSEEAKQAAHHLKYAVSFATMLRLATYIRYGQQKEDLAGSASRADIKQAASELFALPKEALQENGSLFKYYYTALALHSEMNGFFKMLHLRSQIQSDRDLQRTLSVFCPGGKYTAGKEKGYFSSFGFYDTSCAAKITIYNRLLHYEQAAKCAEDHLKKVKAGYNKKKLARTHHNLGVSYYHLGSFDKSFDHFRDSLELLETLYPDGDPQVAAVLRSLGIAHYNLSEFQESLDYFEQSLKMLQGFYQEKNPETAQALVSVGAAHEQLESFEESLEHKHQALKMLQALYPDKDPEVARTLLSLGESYALDGKLKESFKHKQEALEMFRALYGKSHPEVARALLSLGESYALDRKLPASLQHKQQALEMLQALYGSSHPEVARALLSVGESYEAMGQLAESKEYKNSSVAMFEAFYKDTHSEVSQARKSLSRTKSALIATPKERNPVHTSAPSLRPVRTAHPQHLALLPTPRHGKEAAGENTLLRDYYQDDTFACVPPLFEEQRSKHVKGLQCQLMLLEQKQVISFEKAMQLRNLALQDPTPEVRKKNIRDLISLVPSSEESETSVLAGLLNSLALVAVQSQEERAKEAARARKALEGLTAKDPADHWLAEETLPGKLQHFQKQVPQPIPDEQDRLFIQVRRTSSRADFEEAMQLRNLALQDPTPEVRKENIRDLTSLVQPSSGESETSVLADLLNGLALVAVQSQEERAEEADMARKTLQGLTAKDPADHWLAEETLPDKLQYFQLQQFQEPAMQSNPHEQDRLFIRVSSRADHVAKYHERLEWVKTPLGSEDLFKKRSVRPGDPEKEINRILLIGDPGTGKTTLSRQLAYQWSVGEWGQKFDAVYLLPVRSLQQDRYNNDNYRKLNTLATAIANNCFTHPPNDEHEYKQLCKHIDEELKKPTTLVILDGLDERAGACKEILIQAQAGTHKLLMLSRPYSIDAERRLAEIEIEHVGFNREQLKAYVQAEVSASERSAELLGYIQKHENILSIAHVPVNLQILCALWQDEGYDVRKVAQQGSIPSLYRQFIKYIWRRYKGRSLKDQLQHQDREHLFNTLGKVALKALEKGEVLISPGLIDKTLGDDMDAQAAQKAFKDAGFLLLQYVGEDEGKQQGFYEFPHLTFQEYFAGRALAQQCLSENKREQQRADTFLSDHQYESQYGRTLTFMAGEVSKIEGVEGIKKLLNLLEKEKEIVGVQHLRLQLRVLHEWLCVATEREVERSIAEVENEFQVLSSLEEWFVRAFAHVRLEGYNRDGTYLPGYRLLGLLKSSLQTFGSIAASHAPGLLELFKKAAQGPHGAVRLAAVDYLGGAMAGVYDEVRAILQTMADDYHEEDSIKNAARKAFSQAQGAEATQDETAQGSLEGARESAFQSPEDLLAQLRQAAKAARREDDQALSSARGSLVQAVATATQEKFRTLLHLLLPAAKDQDGLVRVSAQAVLWKAPLEKLLAFYWSTTDTSLIPYIAPRLCHTPLVIKSARKGAQQVLLYAAVGQAREWRQPQRVVENFERHVKDAVSQLSEVESRLSARIDKSVWEQYFGAVGEEPELPDGLEAIMDSDCPFWSGSKVRDTHLLALIPEQVSSRPLTLDYLGELIKSPQRGGYGTKYREYYAEDAGDQSPDKSYWVLMTRDVLPGSRTKSYKDQCALVAEADHTNLTDVAYEVPGALEAAVVMLLHHVRKGERLYSDSPVTYTRCQQKVQNYQLFVGGFSSGGLNVDNFNLGHSNGVSALRKF